MHACLPRGRERDRCIVYFQTSNIWKPFVRESGTTERSNKHLLPVQQCTPTTTMKRHIQVSMQSSDFMDSSTATTNWNRFESWHLISISKQIVGVYRIQFFIYTYNRVHDPWREHQAKLNLIGMLNLGWQSAQLRHKTPNTCLLWSS